MDDTKLAAAVDGEVRRMVQSVAPEDREKAAMMLAQSAIDALGRIDTDHAKQTLRGLAARAERAAKHGTVTELDLFYGKAGR